jgi:hypothetical protein
VRAIVSVATGRYTELLDRLAWRLRSESVKFVTWRGRLPPESPPHSEVPYAFKAYAIQAALARGYRQILWCDSSIVPIRALKPLWELIERQGYWFSENLPYGQLNVAPWNCGQWCADSALEPLGITREEAFQIPQVIGTAFGLNFDHEPVQKLFEEFMRLAEERTSFQGAWSNDHGEASSDQRVLGHRHDQTVLSVLARRFQMELTTPPLWIVDAAPATGRTILAIQRAIENRA